MISQKELSMYQQYIMTADEPVSIIDWLEGKHLEQPQEETNENE